MKPKSTAAIIRKIKSRYKSVSYRQAAAAVENKLLEIRKPKHTEGGKAVQMALFGHLA